MANQDLNLQTVTGLFGEASPYGAHLYGQQLGQADRARPLEEAKTLADIESKRLANEKTRGEIDYDKATFGERVKKPGLENILQEEIIVGKRQENWAKGFENTMKNSLGTEFYAENEKLKQAKERVDNMQRSYETLGQAATQIEAAPPVARYAILTKYARQIGMNDHQINALLQVPPEKLPEVMRALAEKTAKMAPEFIREQAMQAIKHKNAMELAKLKAQLDKDLEKLKQSGEGDIKTLQQAVIKFSEMASQLPENDQMRAFYEEKAEYYRSILQATQEAKAAPQYERYTDDQGREKLRPVPPTGPGAVVSEIPVKPTPLSFSQDTARRKAAQTAPKSSKEEADEIMRKLLAPK